MSPRAVRQTQLTKFFICNLADSVDPFPEAEEESEEEQEKEPDMEGLETPSGLSSVASGLETPERIELRKDIKRFLTFTCFFEPRDLSD